MLSLLQIQMQLFEIAATLATYVRIVLVYYETFTTIESVHAFDN